MLRARLIDLLLRLTAPLPLRVLHALGNALGRLADCLPNSARHITRVNIELCFPERDLADKRRLARRALQHSACNLLELGPIWRRRPERTLTLIRSVEGEEIFNRAHAEGRGVLILAPHLGAWELLQPWITYRSTLNVLYRPPRQAWLEQLITGARSRTGARLWPARTSGVRGVLKALRGGETVGILPDQQPPGEGVFAEFFGQPAKTMTLFGKIAARSDAPVLVAWTERLPRGAGFRLHWRCADPEIRAADPITAARALNRSIEAAVREAPCQYQWAYRRFSRQPEGVPNPYKRFRSEVGWVSDTDEPPMHRDKHR